MIRNHLSRWNHPTHYLHFIPWTSNYIQVYDIIFPDSWTVPIELGPSSSNIWWWLPHWTSMTWGLVAQRLGMDWSVGGDEGWFGSRWNLCGCCCCKGSLVGKKNMGENALWISHQVRVQRSFWERKVSNLLKSLGLCHYFESLERHHAPTKLLGSHHMFDT